MTLPVVWIPEADADLKEALAWYESIHPDLGVRFALAADAAVEVIARSPLAFQIVHAAIRRAGVKRFPYGLFYEVESNRIVVIACNAREAQSEAVEASAEHGLRPRVNPDLKR